MYILRSQNRFVHSNTASGSYADGDLSDGYQVVHVSAYRPLWRCDRSWTKRVELSLVFGVDLREMRDMSAPIWTGEFTAGRSSEEHKDNRLPQNFLLGLFQVPRLLSHPSK